MKLALWGRLFAVGCTFFLLSGCASMRQKTSPEAQALKTQVSDLENQLQQKDSEIDSLRKALSRTTEERYTSAKASGSIEENTALPSATQIQTALKNAGYSLTVDGKMGKQTRTAVKDFQKANSLQADGKVGKKTWTLLEPYLNK